MLGSIVSLLSTTAVGLAGRSANDNCVACRDLVAQIYVIHAPVPHLTADYIVRNQNGVLAAGQLPDDTVVTALNTALIALNFHNLGLSRVEGTAQDYSKTLIYISIIGPEVKQSYENHHKPW